MDKIPVNRYRPDGKSEITLLSYKLKIFNISINCILKHISMKKYIVLFCLFYLFVSNINAQKIGIDSKGKSIFTHLSRKEARFEFSTEEPLSLSYVINPKITNFFLTKSGDTTVIKFSGVYCNLSMLNSGDYLIFKNLSEMRPGVGIKLGYQTSIEQFSNIDLIPDNYKGTYTAGMNFILNVDNIKLYNTDNDQVEIKHPLTYGIEGNYNFFFKNRSRNSKKRVALALNASVLRTWNDEDLLNYQTLSNITILSTIAALKDFEGRYGKLNNNISYSRFSISLPIYVSLLNLIPYIAIYSITDHIPQYRLGGFVNILSKSLPKQNFKIPASVGLGIETDYNYHQFSKPIIFLKGAISIGEL
jgi:hypothetical protein